MTVFVCFCASAAFCQKTTSTERKPSTSYQSDPKFDRLVSLNVAGVSLNELLKLCSEKGVRLRAFENCGQLKAQVHVKNRSLKSLMSALAEVFGADWYQGETNEEYVLGTLLKTTKKRDIWWRLFLAEHEKALLANRNGEENSLLKGFVKPNETFNLEKEQLTKIATEFDFFQKLPPTLQQRVLSRNNFDFLYKPEASFTTEDEEGATPALFGDLTPWNKAYLKQRLTGNLEMLQQIERLGWDKIELRFMNVGSNITCGLALPNQHIFMALNFHAQIDDILSQLLSPMHDALPSVLKSFPKWSTPGLVQLANYYKVSVWQNELPKGVPNRSERRSRSDMLFRIASKGGVEIVSDYHSNACIPMDETEKSASLKHKVEVELNEASFLHDASWKKSVDGVFLVRNNRWYRDDYLEAPSDYLKKWLKEDLPIDPKMTFTIDLKRVQVKDSIKFDMMRKRMERVSEIVQNLSPWQIAFGLCYFIPSERDEMSVSVKEATIGRRDKPDGLPTHRYKDEGLPFYKLSAYILDHYRTCLFYASLSKENRDLLMQGELPYAQLNADQRTAVEYIIPSLELRRRQGDEMDTVLLSMIVSSIDTKSITGKLIFKQVEKSE